MFYRIVNRDPNYPSTFSAAACECISGLLQKKEEDRFGLKYDAFTSVFILLRLGNGENGAKDIMTTAFFSVLDFDALLRKEIKPPFKPDVSSELDTAYVPESLLKTEAKDSFSEPAKKGEKNSHFDAFTYKGDSNLDS
jgi:hypothetical protein